MRAFTALLICTLIDGTPCERLTWTNSRDRVVAEETEPGVMSNHELITIDNTAYDSKCFPRSEKVDFRIDYMLPGVGWAGSSREQILAASFFRRNHGFRHSISRLTCSVRDILQNVEVDGSVWIRLYGLIDGQNNTSANVKCCP